MNNDKAIALLRRMQEPEAYEPQITEEAFEALDMAIKALEQATFPQAIENDQIVDGSKKVDDCISRQFMYSLGATCLAKRNDDGELVAITGIRYLPSVQPVITCDGCRFVGTYDTDFPCCSCVRREKDYYEPER